MMAISLNKLARVLILSTIVLSFLFLRLSLIPLYPILALSFFYILGLRIRQNHLILTLAFVLLGLVSSAWEGMYWSNLLLSLYLILPIFAFLISTSNERKGFRNADLFGYFMKWATIVLVIVNISAFIYAQFIADTAVQNYEDTFTGLYGTAGFGSHSLSIINLGFSMYFLLKKQPLKFLFFVICGVMGYYGLGLMVFIVAVVLMYATRILRYWKAILMLLLAGGVMFWFINQFNARNLDYIVTNLERTALVFGNYDYNEELRKAKHMEVTTIPRYMVFLDGALKRVVKSRKVFLLGASPGGYNSRTAFYLNGDFVQNEYLLEKFKNRTAYHEADIFPLLNRELLRKPYNDGTRNQTFSSIVAVILEYGVILGLLYWVIFFSKLRAIRKTEMNRVRQQYIHFLTIYLFLILMVQNYLEYPEIVFPLILLIKLAEVDRVNAAPERIQR